MNAVKWLLLPEIVLVVAGTEMLLRNLPAAIQAAMDENGIRRDGTRSRRRARVERVQVRKLRPTLCLAFAIVFIPTNLAVCILDPHADQIVAVARSSWRLPTSPSVTTEETQARQAKRDIDELAGRTGMDARAMTRVLDLAAPAVLCGVCVWGAACIYIVRTAYIHTLKRLTDGIQSRADQYYWLDLARYEEAHPEVPRPSDRSTTCGESESVD